MANELFIVEYPDGQIDDAHDMGGFTVFLDRRSAEEALQCCEESDNPAVVRFVRDTDVVAMAVELAALRAHEERARWCEEMKADVRWNPVRKLWVPQWWKDGVLNQVSHPDRNAAIDAAMKGGK